MDEPTPEQREALAELGAHVVRTEFDGIKKRAYTAADVNSGTWDRFEKGLELRSDRLVGIVKALWPETGGDWRRVPLSVGPNSEDDSYVAAPGERSEGGVGNDAVLRAIEQMRQDMQEMEQRLSERVDRLEQSGP